MVATAGVHHLHTLPDKLFAFSNLRRPGVVLLGFFVVLMSRELNQGAVLGIGLTRLESNLRSGHDNR